MDQIGHGGHMDHIGHVIEINRRSVFSHEEAQELLPVIFRITKSYSLKVEALISRLDALAGANEQTATNLETQVNALIQEWQAKVTKLGALPKGLWIADFDSGDGYFCWKYPERGIDFWHKYTDGFSKRVCAIDRLKPIRLDERIRKKLQLQSERSANHETLSSEFESGFDPELQPKVFKKIPKLTSLTLRPSEIPE